MKVRKMDTSDRMGLVRSRFAATRHNFVIGTGVCRARPAAIGLACLIFWVGAVSVCGAQQSERKKKTASSSPDPGLGKLSRQLDDPEAYMRDMSNRLNSSSSQRLLNRGMSRQGWRPSSPSTASATDGTLPPLENEATEETPVNTGTRQGLSDAPSPSRFGWSPGDDAQLPTPSRFGWTAGDGADSTSTDAELARLRSRGGAGNQTWMSPTERARQIDPLASVREMKDSEPAPPTAAEPTARDLRGWTAPQEQEPATIPDGARVLGQATATLPAEADTWIAPQQPVTRRNLDGVRLLGTGSSDQLQPWQYATPPQQRQVAQNQLPAAAPRETAAPVQNSYAGQPAPQRQPAAAAPPWQAAQNQAPRTAPKQTVVRPQETYAAQSTPPWAAAAAPSRQGPQQQTAPATPSETAAPVQNSYARQTTPPWPTPTDATAAPSDNQVAQMAMGELETVYPTQRAPEPTAPPADRTARSADVPTEEPAQVVAQSPPATNSTVSPQRSSESLIGLTQTWLSPKNRAAQAALQEIATVDRPQDARLASTMPVGPATPPTPAPRPEMGPTPGGRGSRTAVNGSQARHFYEEKEPAWSLGADLDKYRAHAVQEGSRESGESIEKALKGIGLAIEDTTNIITLGYASDRAKPFRSNDGKGFFQEPGRVPQQAGETIGSLGDGLYSVADLVTFNALPDSQKAAYLDNHPVVRPLVFTGRTIGGAWKTTEEIGNALTWGYFDNVTGSIGMCIESLIEALKHTGEAVTNLARLPVRLVTGNNEKADEALDWVLLVPLEMASNVVQMKGISNMADYETAFADKGVIGSILEFGGSTFIVYTALDELVDELDDNGSRSSSGSSGGSSGPVDPGTGGGYVPPPTGPGIIFWFEEGWPTGGFY